MVDSQKVTHAYKPSTDQQVAFNLLLNFEIGIQPIQIRCYYMTTALLSSRYLYKSSSDGVQDYLCNRLYSLPEKGLERYLSQLCQLIINRPHSSLERVVVDLCARSLRIAVKVGPRLLRVL